MIRATVRLQFHKDFTLDDGTALVPYMASLGASHLYASPLLKARPGSTHGYDIVDHHTINPELGGEEALRRMVAALRAHDMGLILDIVPNHMGVGGSDNAWWLDVLEWGRASPYSGYFDIDWDPPDATLRNKLLAPFLGAPYGDALAAGDIKLRFDPQDGRLFVSVYDEHRFPLDPRTYDAVLRGHVQAPLFDRLGGGRDGRQRAEQGRAALRAEAAAVATALEAFDGSTASGQEALHRLLERQNYRLAWWRAAADEINWRRFFDITSLAGVRQEEPGVFEDTHAKVLAMYAEGLIDGVRIDHVDGLADPRSYCRKLRRQMQTTARERPPGLQPVEPIIWVEKILAPHEELATDWLTDGTTGYDFMDEVAGVLHDPAGEAKLTEIWTRETGRPGAFEDEARPARRQILREILFSELYATSAALHRIARRHLRTRDHTLTAIRRVLQEVLVHFHVYRIYAGMGGISEVDRRVLDWAMAGARRTIRSADHPLLDLVDGWLSGEGIRETAAGPRRQERLRAMVRFQQLSAPTAAKSIEDTAFYRYGRLLSRNEVGSEPDVFALSAAAFHAANRDRHKHYPRCLLATATHDHKRGEDTRVRLAVLSEVPEEWEAALARWTRLNASLRREIDRAPAPDGADELMLYQMLVAAWPLGLSPTDRAGCEAFRERVAAWQVKALREAKRKTGWTKPAEDYETACADFLTATLDSERPARVVHEIAAFAERLAVPGAINSLSQTVLRLTSPGVPDLYQGAEFWDFSLVDPDNRRPVDWAAREAALQANEPPAALLEHWRDGRVKQAVIARVLAFRRRAAGLFAAGSYVPLEVEGAGADHILAFARIHEGRAAICVATRLPARLLNGAEIPVVPASAWDGTSVVVPRHLVTRRCVDVLLSREEDQLGPERGHAGLERNAGSRRRFSQATRCGSGGSMNRLVVVSNRVPTPGSGSSAGGLAVALEGLMDKRGGVWFGWSGSIAADAAAKPIHCELVAGVTYATIDLTQEEHDSYYGRFSNGVLWPLLHTMPQLMDYERRDAQMYRDVNARFADSILSLLKPNDILWVHDYHLLALPALLRARGVRNPIGFFLHIPFPSPDVLSSAPEAAALTRDLLGADLIGFQTDRDVANFTAAASQIAGAVQLEDGWLGLYGRRIRLGAFPVEIEAQDFAQTASRAAGTPAAERLRRSLQGQKLILGVDRLDPTKGLVQRLDGLRRLLETRPSWRRNLTFLQIAAVSRKDVQAYQELREELDREGGALNSEYGDPDWSPLRIIARGAVRSVVAGYMRLAAVGLVTPLRDGMNLVAKEYVAAQDPDNPGVLVLSRFAGAARQLESAILVNPHDPDDMADAMDRALRMELSERRARQAALWKVIADTTPVSWGRSFLAEMVRAVTAGDAPVASRPRRADPISTPRGKTQSATKPPDFELPTDPRRVN